VTVIALKLELLFFSTEDGLGGTVPIIACSVELGTAVVAPGSEVGSTEASPKTARKLALCSPDIDTVAVALRLSEDDDGSRVPAAGSVGWRKLAFGAAVDDEDLHRLVPDDGGDS